jgi:DNA-binding NarL/FixJ family response regulator
VAYQRRHQDFVGRAAELAVFDRAVADARRGLPTVLLIGGEAGMGKTTLVAEGAFRAEAELYLGRATHIGGEVIPLAPLVDLLRQMRRAAPDLVADPAPRPPVAVLDLLTQLGSDDVVVVGFEDLHWADAMTWDLFEFLARNLIDERLVLVGTYRANEVGDNVLQRRRLAELSRVPAARRINLGGLERAEVTERVTALLGDAPSAAFVDQIVARGQGNPFFTEELVAAHMAGESIPTVLSDLITAEIADLDDRTREVVGAIAAVGRETNHDLLRAIVDLTNDELEKALRNAVDTNLIVVDAKTDAYRFRHPLLGEVAYAELLPPQRARLHRRIADAIQNEPPAVLARADRAGEVAFHLDRSGDTEAAFVALLAAADAAQGYAPRAALGHLERAFELWDTVGESSVGVDRSARLWQAAELASAAVGHLRAVELARAATQVGPAPFGAPWAHERLGRYLWLAGALDESRVEYERAAELLAGVDDAQAAAVFAGLAQAELMSARYESAERTCNKVFELVPFSETNPEAWAMASRVLGIVRSNRGDADDAVQLCRESVAATTSAQTRGLALIYLCVALLDAGRYQDASNTALDAVADGERAGLEQGFGDYFDGVAAEALTRLGAWPEAEAILARRVGGDALPVGRLRLERAGALLAARRGDRARARSLLAQAQAEPIDGWHQTVLDATTADVCLVLGDWAAAVEAAERGWDAAAEACGLWAARFAMFSVTALVEQTLDQQARREPVDLAAVVAKLELRVDAARALSETTQQLRSLEAAAHLAHASASLTLLTTPDADAWAEAARRWTALGDPYATASTLLHEAESAASVGDADRAARTLREAYSVASSLGAEPLRAQIEAVSRRTRVSVEAPARIVLDGESVSSLGLTPREAEVLTLVAAGRTNRQIGDELFVSEKTASVHVSNILRKLGVTSRVDAAAVAQRLGVA